MYPFRAPSDGAGSRRGPAIANVAPDELLLRDFQQLDARETLRCAWQNERNLLIQSVASRAQEGHGLFHGHRYVNTSTDNVARALLLDPDAVRRERQALMDGVTEYADRVIAGGDGAVLVDNNGTPLLGMGTLLMLPPLDGKSVLRGLCYGAMRDDDAIRVIAEAKYPLTIGGGKSYLVHLESMDRAGLNAERLAHENHDQAAIDDLWRQGVILADDGPDTDDSSYLYILHRRGCGTSDDACIVLTGLVHGFGAGVGAFLADALDTLEKYVPIFGGSDIALAERITKNMPDLGVTAADAAEIAYLCADESGHVPDSSLRHLLSVDRRYDQCAAEAHLAYMLGRPYAPLGLSHERVPAGEFYAYCEERLAWWREQNGIENPTAPSNPYAAKETSGH